MVRGGGEETRRTILAVLVACMFATVSGLSIAPVAAESDEAAPILWSVELDVVWEPSPHWIGTVATLAGDSVGSIEITENPATFPGMTEHFDESFAITTTDGAVISGFDLGVYNLNTFKFRANGWVTDASSAAWENLVGCKVHFSGTTTPLVIGGEVHGVGTLMLVAA